jgi:putative transposase
MATPHRNPYPSDLSDAEWDILKPLLPRPKGFGHPVEVDFREILNGIFYVHRTGCPWEMLPHELPPYTTLYHYFQKWQRKGIWQPMHDQIRHQLRQTLGRDDDSSGAIADAQSVKTTETRGKSPGAMVARRLKGVSATSSSIFKDC